MAYKRIQTIGRYEGVSTDIKPTTDIKEGSQLSELDTGRKFTMMDGAWKEDMSEFLTIGRAIELNNELRALAEQTLLEVQAANRTNGIVP